MHQTDRVAVRPHEGTRDDPHTLAALAEFLCATEEVIHWLPGDEEFRPGLLQLRSALLARLQKRPLSAVPRRSRC